MQFLLLNQTFYPDVMATGQYLTQVALELANRGHQVTVVTSRRAYDDPQKKFVRTETWHGIRIFRVGSTGFGKSNRWRRAADFGSFFLCCALRVLFLPRHDVLLALTSPPLISFLASIVARLRGSRFVYWVMDLNPDEAIAAGWLRADSAIAQLLEAISRASLNRADKVIALDRFMRDCLLAKGISRDKITVLPPWCHDDFVRFDAAARERFRSIHGLEGKFVVMYSGNHSPCHPLNTLLEAARQLATDREIVFCFIGGGSEWRRIKLEAAKSQPRGRNEDPGSREVEDPASLNVLCLPYQPLDQLSGSLSSADLHVVAMGDPFVGLVHPCKVYNILNVGAPLLYIGPESSHLSEIIGQLGGQHVCASATHGDVGKVIQSIQQVRQRSSHLKRQVPTLVRSVFAKRVILPKIVAEICGQKPVVN